MRDFKPYPTGPKKTGRNLLKIILLVTFTITAVWLFMSLKDQPTQGEAVQPEESESNSDQNSDRITVPLLLPGQNQKESRALPEPSDILQGSQVVENAAIPASADIAPIAVTENAAAFEAIDTRRISREIVQGDTLSSIFMEMGLSAALLHQIVHSSKTAARLTDIKPGQILHLELNGQRSLKSLTLERDKIHSLHIKTLASGFSSSEHSRKVEFRTAHIQGIIENSLYLSAKEAGLPEATILELAEIFGWDIDFALEIRSGDSFTVIYEEEFLEGDKLRTGPILAAEFVNQGRTYRAVRYASKTGKAAYYTPEGNSMRKPFLRAPVDFRRISSYFAKQRWHPVLGKKRPHRGVDYAANTGTPIKAAGDGKIIHRGKKGGYGNTLIIQHAQGYTTLYGHLSRYAITAKKGSQVEQGEVIGYVGQSGLATGPHLHYEFRINGVHRDPLTVKLPDSMPIDKKYRADFLLKTQPLIAKLDTFNRILVADAR